MLEPHLRQRLSADFSDLANPRTRVLEVDGSPTALTLDELATEFRASPIFRGLRKGSQASGSEGEGDAPGNRPRSKPTEPVDTAKMSWRRT